MRRQAGSTYDTERGVLGQTAEFRENWMQGEGRKERDGGGRVWMRLAYAVGGSDARAALDGIVPRRIRILARGIGAQR